MSIAVLTQVYDEARRLAVAGSVVARGDFRLKKLLPPLEQAGAKAPVFAKVAECAKGVIDGPEESSAESLLELTSLVTAVLYTQGETGLPGALQPIETIDLGGAAAQTSARLLKPLLEALSSTGSGRLELIKDAHQRGAFRDLRLVKPALGGLDDPYPEIADFLAESVLPLYGKAILPELRATYDPKGTKGHARRLKLMHTLDPAGSRDLVTQALDAGSKEVKVAAVSCLGADKEDLSYLIEQTTAKAQDVRAAAYQALAALDDPAAAAVLQKAVTGKDVRLAAAALGRSTNDWSAALAVAEIGKERAALPKLKDKKQVSESVHRLRELIGALPDRPYPAADALVLDLFARRGELAKVKGDDLSGSDVVESVIARMLNGPKPLQTALARAHGELDVNQLGLAVVAAVRSLPPADVYDLFAPYVTAKVDEKKKGKDLALAKREMVISRLGGFSGWGTGEEDQDAPTFDPRWLDLAVRIKNLGLIHIVGRPGHAGAEKFLQETFDAQLKKPQTATSVNEVVTTMVRLRHPAADVALVQAVEKTIGKASQHYIYWYSRLIPELPKHAISRLEAVVPKLKDRDADLWLRAIQELREKEE